MRKKILLLLLLLGLVPLALPVGGQTGAAQYEWGLEDRPHRVTQQSVGNVSFFPPPFDRMVPALSGLGDQIDTGRQRGDVNSLVNAALMLHQAEKILGRQSPVISSEGLLAEAAQIARDQKDTRMLSRIIGVWQDPSRGPTSSAQASQARYFMEEVDKEQADMMHKRRCRIVLHNRTDQFTLDVMINRKPAASLEPNSLRVMGDVIAGRQVLTASNDAGFAWGPRQVFVAPGEVFHWKLFD